MIHSMVLRLFHNKNKIKGIFPTLPFILYDFSSFVPLWVSVDWLKSINITFFPLHGITKAKMKKTTIEKMRFFSSFPFFPSFTIFAVFIQHFAAQHKIVERCFAKLTPCHTLDILPQSTWKVKFSTIHFVRCFDCYKNKLCAQCWMFSAQYSVLTMHIRTCLEPRMATHTSFLKDYLFFVQKLYWHWYKAHWSHCSRPKRHQQHQLIFIFSVCIALELWHSTVAAIFSLRHVFFIK